MRVIGVCGYGYTGSGAVVDLLKEYASISCFDKFEFSLVYIPDGILDLDYHLNQQASRFMSSDVAISRFMDMVKKRNHENGYNDATNGLFYNLSMDYIRSITSIQWKGFWNYDYYYASKIKKIIGYKVVYRRLFRGREKVLKANQIYPYKNMYLSINPPSFKQITKNYIRDVISSLFQNKEVENVVLNQPFPANCPSSCFHFFDDPKAIVVDRDPRDMYIFVKEVAKTGGAWIPTDSVSDFILYYRLLHQQEQDRENVLRVHFEDLIYHYDKTVNCIEQFLNLSKEKHIDKYGNFNPKESISNVQLFRRYDAYTDDIKVIERELSEYLYDFSDLEKPNDNLVPFDK